jgi:hypothetical protein
MRLNGLYREEGIDQWRTEGRFRGIVTRAILVVVEAGDPRQPIGVRGLQIKFLSELAIDQISVCDGQHVYG